MSNNTLYLNEMKNINANELTEFIANNTNTKIIDVRTKEEFQSGKINEAINYNFFDTSFPDKIKALDNSKTYIMVCMSGNRSSAAAALMLENGFSNVFNLTGRMIDWNGEVVK